MPRTPLTRRSVLTAVGAAASTTMRHDASRDLTTTPGCHNRKDWSN